MRLNQFLSRSGVASRRKAEELISGERVRVNGKIASDLSAIVDEDRDTVEIMLAQQQKVWQKIELVSEFCTYALNKPHGYTSTVADPHADKSVLELVPQLPKVVPVGRLDKDSEGLLLLSNDGNLIYHLTHPSRHIAKTYHVVCTYPRHYATEQLSANMQKLESGVMLDEIKTAPAKVRLIATNNLERTIELEIAIREGRNRQIRRMMQKIGLNVLQLTRTSVGQLHLRNLKLAIGQYKKLTDHDLTILKTS